MRLRQISLQTNRETRLQFIGAGIDCADLEQWGGQWEMSVGDRGRGSNSWDLLPEDSYEDGLDDDQSTALVDIGSGGNFRSRDICLGNWGDLSGGTMFGQSHPDSILFSPRGWIANPVSDFNTRGYLEIEMVNQEAARMGVLDTITVQLTRAGMVRLVSYDGQFPENNVGTSL